MTQKIQAIRGMPDILPEEMHKWHYVEELIKELTTQYGLCEIRFPILEATELFKRSVGDVTDIVEKEMYSFHDRNGDSLTLRPEGTASCVRAALQHGLIYNQAAKLWYMGPMYRHERPQKGRYRQFYQFGMEFFGVESILSDVEVILFLAHFFKRCGLLSHLTLQINSLGTPEERKQYKTLLVQYLLQYEEQLDEEAKRRLHTNPLRILDSKNPNMAAIIADAPKLIDHLSESSKVRFDNTLKLLEECEVQYEVVPTLVRGLDYYTHTVFEWVDQGAVLGAQATVCAGGRYDGLVEQLGGQATPAIGCAMGIERLILMLSSLDLLPSRRPYSGAYIIFDEAHQAEVIKQVQQWRITFPQLQLTLNPQGGSMKKQFKRADKSTAQWAFILGEEELAKKEISIKFLREDYPQASISYEKLREWLQVNNSGNMGI